LVTYFRDVEGVVVGRAEWDGLVDVHVAERVRTEDADVADVDVDVEVR
jgi:hypothetical protein